MLHTEFCQGRLETRQGERQDFIQVVLSQAAYSNADVGARAAIGPSTDILNNFVMARTMFDHTLDPEALIDEWCAHFHFTAPF
jgi:hypothetical protein